MTLQSGLDLAAMRRSNAQTVLGALIETGRPATVTALAASTGLSRPTVDALLADLLRDGRVTHESTVRGGPGRPARLFSYAADRGVVLGLDTGPHDVRGVLADLAGNELVEHRLTGIDLSSANDALAGFRSVTDHLLAHASFRYEDVVAVGLGMPGVVDHGGRLVLTKVVPDWIDADVPGQLRDVFASATVRIENDAKLAALAELRSGILEASSSAVVLQISHRLAAAVVTEGRVARGARGAAGEVGALERFGWTSALAELRDDAPEFDAVADLFAACDTSSTARRAVARFAERIADGVAALTLAIDPSIVVVGGAASAAGRHLAEPLQAALSERCVFTPELALSLLGDRAAVVGAVGLAVEHVRSVEMSGVTISP